jgi:hypothetical protein
MPAPRVNSGTAPKGRGEFIRHCKTNVRPGRKMGDATVRMMGAGSGPRPLNKLVRIELSMMPKNKPTAGPMRTQPIGRASIVQTPVLPRMPATGEATALMKPKKKPTRADGVRVAKAKITRRNSLRRQRDALKG